MMYRRFTLLPLLPLTLATFMLLGCNKNQPVEKTTPVTSTAAAEGSAASASSASTNTAAWLQVKEKEYGDSGVIVTLQAKLDGGGREATIQWRQVDGPSVTLINAQQLQAQVVVPQVEEPTRLTFEITAVSRGETLRARQVVVALPLPVR
ncbi:MAG: hypothetical protein U5M23_09850, partial [Marinagarivorans sp.]|nr:hypothetical protein [Marinagarivorans sp.]